MALTHHTLGFTAGCRVQEISSRRLSRLALPTLARREVREGSTCPLCQQPGEIGQVSVRHKLVNCLVSIQSSNSQVLPSCLGLVAGDGRRGCQEQQQEAHVPGHNLRSVRSMEQQGTGKTAVPALPAAVEDKRSPSRRPPSKRVHSTPGQLQASLGSAVFKSGERVHVVSIGCRDAAHEGEEKVAEVTAL